MAAMLDGPWGGTNYTPPTAIDIATIETAIVAQLQSQVAGIEIAHYPDRPESYRLVHRVGAALVQYLGAKYGAMLDTAAIIQERVMEFGVTVMMRDLGWNYGAEADGPSPGAYSILEAIRAALTGFRIPGCRKIYPRAERFVERDKQGGVWIYIISFGLATLAVEPSTSEDYPLFIRGVAMEESGQSLITVAPAPFTFNSAGTIQLPNGNLSAVVVTATGGAVLAPGTDYSLDPVNGIVTALAGGAIAAGATVWIAYSYADYVTATPGETSPIS
ncbi:MAG TPA: Gp37 family protein [Candidatus Binataceae bacterium]|nr:Gp37 family protein [Candidatus Binataceae bacterium]